MLQPPVRAVLLCLIAGYIDAIGYIDYEHVFAANMTGNTVLLAISAAEGEWAQVATHALALAAFVAGALAAEAMKRVGLRATWPLLLSGLPLIAVYGMPPDVNEALALLALGMGLQGGSVARFADINVQTVVITGTILKLSEAAVCRLMPGRGTTGPALPPNALSVFALTWVAYGVGAVLSLAAKDLGAAKLLLPLVPLIPVALAEGKGAR